MRHEIAEGGHAESQISPALEAGAKIQIPHPQGGDEEDAHLKFRGREFSEDVPNAPSVGSGKEPPPSQKPDGEHDTEEQESQHVRPEERRGGPPQDVGGEIDEPGDAKRPGNP